MTCDGYYEDDRDYDKFREEVDMGKSCPFCFVNGKVEVRTPAKGQRIPPYRCMLCNRVWKSWDTMIARRAKIAAKVSSFRGLV